MEILYVFGWWLIGFITITVTWFVCEQQCPTFGQVLGFVLGGFTGPISTAVGAFFLLMALLVVIVETICNQKFWTKKICDWKN